MTTTIKTIRKAIVKNMTPTITTRPSSMMRGYTIFSFTAGGHWTVDRVCAVMEELDIEYLILDDYDNNNVTFQTKQGEYLLTQLTLMGLL